MKCFCGETPILYRCGYVVKGSDNIQYGFYVECPNCKCTTDIKGTKKSALTKWNQHNVITPTLKSKIAKQKKFYNDISDVMSSYILAMDYKLAVVNEYLKEVG